MRQVISVNKMPRLKIAGWLPVLSMCVLAVSATAANPLQASEGTPSKSTLAAVSPFTEAVSPLASLAAPGMPRDWMAPDNTIFYDHPLILRQCGYGVLTGLVAGSLGFYIGNAFEGMIFDHNSHKGYLSFTGIRYEHSRRFLGMPAGGPFLGGTIGLLGGSSLMVFFTGDADEEPGSVFWTVAGGALTTVAALALADVAGVGEDRGMLPFIPLLALPPIGAVGGYHVSRWFNDAKRHRITEPGRSATGPVFYGPRVGMTPGPDGMVTRLEALRLTF